MRADFIFLFLIWATTQFCFQTLVFYVKHIPGDIFEKIGIQSIIDTFACSVAGILAQILGTQQTMTLSFLVATIGGILIAISNTHEMILVGLLVTRLGIDCSYCLIYVLTMEKFPSSIQARLFGIFTLSASVSTILSPIIAEMDDPLPLFLYIIICFLSMVSSLTLEKI